MTDADSKSSSEILTEFSHTREVHHGSIELTGYTSGLRGISALKL